MRSYHQYCSVAKALDHVGDRWVLLIVRELLAFGPSRYSDLRRGLPGVATNLLAERLRTMETDGLIERHDAPAPIAATLYQLTPRGRELEQVLGALGQWGMRLMPAGPAAEDAVQPQWMALLAGLKLRAGVAAGTEVVIGLETEEEPVRLLLRSDGFTIERGALAGSDLTLTGDARLVGGTLSGLLSIREAKRRGLKITGRQGLLADLLDSA